MSQPSITALTALGFTPLEGEVYSYLLKSDISTGYGIARAIGRPTANTYKAIEALAQKGAVIVDEGRTRQCRAVPAGELMQALERQFRRRRDEAMAVLSEPEATKADERIYKIDSQELVIERARTMLTNCREMAVLDIFPEPLAYLRDDLIATAKRGIRVAAKVYEPVDLGPVQTVMLADPERVLEYWPGQQLNLNIDALQHLLALIETNTGRVTLAVWSESTFLSCLNFSGLASEILMTRLYPHVTSGDRADDASRDVAEIDWLLDMQRPGFTLMRERVQRKGERECPPNARDSGGRL